MFEDYKNLFIIYSLGITSICFLSYFTYYVSSKFSIVINKKNSNYIFIFSFLFYFISIFYLTFGKINALHHYVDFGTVLEILWKNYQGYGLTTLMSENHHGGSHWFGAHFTPILYLTYIPIFAIYPNPHVIPISETFFILSSLIPLWLISKKYLDDNSSRLLISSFLFYPTIFYTNLYGTAFIELCIPLFLWLFYFLEEKNNKLFILTLILCLMVREEISLVTSFLGIYLIIKKRYLLGFFTFTLSLVYFYIVLFIVMPSFRIEDFNEIHITSSWFKEWGNSYSEMIKNILFKPIDVLNKILIPPKIGNFVLILIPLLFLPLSSILIFLIAIPNLGITFLSSAISHSSFILYYLSPSLPIFFYATIKGISKLKNFKFVNKSSLINSVLVASITTTIFFGATPISLPFWFKNYEVGKFYTTDFHYSAYRVEQNDIVAKELALIIPDDANVSAEQHFLPLLYKKRKMTVFPFVEQDTSYILIDKFGKTKTGWTDTYLEFRNNPNKFYKKYLDSDKWQIIKSINGVMLLKKNNF